MTVTQTISIDAALQSLADQQRRSDSPHLVESDAPELIDQFHDTVFTQPSSPLGPDELGDRFRIRQQHVHLPKLRDAGLIEYDMSNQTIKHQMNDMVEDLLEVCTSK